MSSKGSPIVETKKGKVKGMIMKNVDGGEYFLFNGIPYAEPPLGQLRFKDPLPLKPWDGVRNLENTIIKATQYDVIMQFYAGTEDCLYLNVSTKSLDGKRPVMVWVHGGGFVMSTASSMLYGADYLIKQDVVIVTVGYRLGCFGFLNLDLPEASGNQGLKDLVLGLKWVQENIEKFGGDPGNVTLFGESAGGACVHYITLSPLADGLYHKAIVQSGVVNSPWTFSENPVEIGLQLTAKLSNRSVNDPTEALAILMKATTDQLIKAQRKLTCTNLDWNLVFNFVPSLDSKCPNPFMPGHPKEISKRGINVPLIIGTTSEEGILCAVNPCIEETYHEINTDFPIVLARSLKPREIDSLADLVKPVKNFYFGEATAISSKIHKNDFVRLMGDLFFYIGTHRAIEIQSNLSTPTYVYQFSYRPSYPTLHKYMNIPLEGSSHGDEIGALFHSAVQTGTKGLQKGTKDYLVMQRLTRMWTNFAKTGNPTVKLDDKVTINWEPITKDKMNYMEIGENLVAGVNFGETSWNFWKPIVETLQ